MGFHISSSNNKVQFNITIKSNYIHLYVANLEDHIGILDWIIKCIDLELIIFTINMYIVSS